MTITYQLQHIGEAAQEFLQLNAGKHLFAFYGKMGAGKTTFIKALCDQLGVVDTVNSPTFAIVNEYQTRDQQTIYHFDCYRLQHPRDAFDIGFQDYVNSGNLCFIEWPEQIEPLIDDSFTRVDIAELPDGSRTISFPSKD